MSKMEEFVIDEPDFLKVSDKTRRNAIRVCHVVMFIVSWVTVGLYIWDCVASYISYIYWNKLTTLVELKHCLYAWLAFTIIGSILLFLFVYNTIIQSIKYFSKSSKCKSLPHQYSTFISYYLFDIPKAIILLIIMIKFSVIPDEYKLSSGMLGSSPAPMYYLGYSKYDHIYYKIIFDVLKISGLFVLAIIEFVHILKHDRNRFFLAANCFGIAIHTALMIASTIYKINLEKNN